MADKSFLITIGDRTVTGLVARDQFVGPWQVPVADCAVTAAAFESYPGLPHRLELVATIDGVRYINDSKATNAESTSNALKSYENIYFNNCYK